MAVVSLRPNSSEPSDVLMFIGGYAALSGILLGSVILFVGVLLIPLGILLCAAGGVLKLIKRK